MSDHNHHHSPPDALEQRVARLEKLLIDKQLVDPAALAEILDTYAERVGPRNGARVVARAWTDDDYRKRLLKDATAAVAELGYTGRQGEHIRAVENTDQVHNVVVCTLCSCYPWPLLGLPPDWYKASAYRARVVIEPRAVLAEFGLDLPPETDIRVWDSTAEIRYLVVPQRPPESADLAEEQLADWVSRDAMIGTALAQPPA